MYLFDTNILSEVMRRRPHVSVISRLAAVPRSEQFTSCICAMELRYGSRRRADHQRFWARIKSEVLSRVTVLALTPRAALIAGDVLARLSRVGRRIGSEDLLIAATALENRLTLVTRNIDELSRVPGLKLENWFEIAT